MPSKRRKYNARFPAGRIKKIMQTDEDVGKVAQAVPIIISRTLELFVESLLRQTVKITTAKNAKTLSPSHMKQCIISESRFDFLKDLVKSLPDVNTYDDDVSGGVCSSEGDTMENIPVMPNASDPSLSSLSGFSGPKHSGETNPNKCNNRKEKARNKDETDSEDSDSVETDKADADGGNDSDFVIDEDYDV